MSVALPPGNPETALKVAPPSVERNTPPDRPPCGCTAATRTTWVVPSATPSPGLASRAVGSTRRTARPSLIQLVPPLMVRYRPTANTWGDSWPELLNWPVPAYRVCPPGWRGLKAMELIAREGRLSVCATQAGSLAVMSLVRQMPPLTVAA